MWRTRLERTRTAGPEPDRDSLPRCRIRLEVLFPAIQTSQNMLRCSLTWPSSRCIGPQLVLLMFQYVSICFNMFQYVSICFNMFQYSPGVWTCSFHWGLEYQLRAAYWPFHPREREYNALPNNLTFLFTSEVDAATSSFDLPGRLDDIFQSAKLHTLGRSPYSSPLSP